MAKQAFSATGSLREKYVGAESKAHGQRRAVGQRLAQRRARARCALLGEVTHKAPAGRRTDTTRDFVYHSVDSRFGRSTVRALLKIPPPPPPRLSARDVSTARVTQQGNKNGKRPDTGPDGSEHASTRTVALFARLLVAPREKLAPRSVCLRPGQRTKRSGGPRFAASPGR